MKYKIAPAKDSIGSYRKVVEKLYSPEESKVLVDRFSQIIEEWSIHQKRLNYSDYVVYDESNEVGFIRVQTTIKTSEIYGGFVECINEPEVAQLLTQVIYNDAQPESKIFFPVDLSIWHRYRFMSGGLKDPVFDLPEQVYYADLFEPYFLDKEAYSSYSQSLNLLLTFLKFNRLKLSNFSFRNLDPTKLDKEISLAYQLSSKIFNEGYSIPTLEEFKSLYLPILSYCKPELVQFMEIENETVGFCFALQVDKAVCFKTIGVLPEWRSKGIGTLLIKNIAQAAKKMGCTRVCYLYLRDNRSISKMVPPASKKTTNYILYKGEK